MRSNLNGYVLRPSRLATGNSPSTAEATSGVSREHIDPTDLISLGYEVVPIPTRPLEPYADMYRASVLLRPERRVGTDEYIIWAATTGSLSTVESDAFKIVGGSDSVTPSAGSLTVGLFSDGTDTLFVQDAGSRDISTVKTLSLMRGDTSAIVTASFASQDPYQGRVVLDAPTLTALGGGFSRSRGDTVLTVSYILSGAKFWWSRNDQSATRFGWDGSKGRWTPFRGSLPDNLGTVGEGGEYELSPPPSRFSIGDELPGDPGIPDGFALLRAGLFPDASAVPLSVLVVSDSDTEGDYPAAGATYDAVVGVSNGIVRLNPITYIPTRAGLNLWHNPESFRQDNKGDLGALSSFALDSSLGHPVLSPVPDPTARPFVRLGFRRHLTPIPVDTDADLPLPSGVPERSFYWSRTTGKIVLSEMDIKKSLPAEAAYDIAYLENKVWYDGVSLGSRPLPIREASPCVNASGLDLIGTDAGGAGIPGSGPLYIKKSAPLPPPGAAGVLYVPDGTGESPDLATDPETRPNGSGLVRQVVGVGDSFIFSSSKAYEDLTVKEYEDDLPRLKIKVRRNETVISLLSSDTQPVGYVNTSRVQIKRRGVLGEALFFQQAQVTPSVYSEEARLYSRYQEPFDLEGTEIMRFAVDGVTYTWDASVNLGAGTFTASDIAADITTFITGTGSALEVRGRVAIQAGSLSTGTVEIGWNTDEDNLSGHAVLGFLPAWRVDAANTKFRWQPDNGSSVGLYRSPENLDRSGTEADIKAVGRFTSEVLTDSIPAVPFFNISTPPLVDIPGFDEGVHFIASQGLNLVRMSSYGVVQGVGVKYDFEHQRLVWTEDGTVGPTPVLTPSDTLQMKDQYVLPETMSSLAMAPTGPNYGLFLKDLGDTVFTELLPNTDFVMPGNGAPGQAQLISPEGALVSSGGGGLLTVGGGFSNPSLSPDPVQDLALQMNLLATVHPGYLLQIINGAGAGVYRITSKILASGTAEFGVDPAFSVGDSGVSWRIFEGQSKNVFDPTVVADVKQVVFNHFTEEPWKIRLLSPIGVVGSTLTASVADALKSGRETRIRFGLNQPPASQEAGVTYLTQGVKVGALVENGLTVPDLSDPHYTGSNSLVAHFQLRVGGDVFGSLSSNLTVVSSFSAVTPPGEIEVGDAGLGGVIRFATDLVDALAGEDVYYDQLPLDPVLLPPGNAEIDPNTGEVHLSGQDLVTYAGQKVYFVEQMITEGFLDVSISPFNGSILFNKPLREWQIVETQYFRADSSGDPVGDEIVEYLPLDVRLEEATAIDVSTFAFNPTGRTLLLGNEFVWAGVELQNFAGVSNATVNANNTIAFGTPPETGTMVRINYFVLEAFGGEQGYTVSTSPVSRKPFFLQKGQDKVILEGDRTDVIEVGKLGVLGDVPFYVKDVSYNASSHETSVTFWPPPLNETGSRAPGLDAEFSLSDRPVAITVDPLDPVAGGGSEGFLLEVDISVNPFLPADRGQSDISFVGDLTRFARSGHLLEIAGYPYIVTASDLSADGRYTKISISGSIYKGHAPPDEVRLSVRPVYSPDPVEFTGVGGFQEGRGYNLFLLGRADDAGNPLPGVELVEGVHFEVDPSDGHVVFKSPSQGPLKPGEEVVALFAALDPVGPASSGEEVFTPFFKSRYLFITTPSGQNRLLNSTLQARYTYSAPDTFYLETIPLAEYLSEVTETALSKVTSSSRSGGVPSAFPGSLTNSKQGALGLRGEVRDLKDQDRAARGLISQYHGVVQAFEQVLEAIDGRIIGDRDGKFKFFVGKGKRYAAPGFEDQISGDIVQRLVWRDIIDEWSTPTLLSEGYFTEDDPVFNPRTAQEKDPIHRPGATDGETPSPDTLRFFVNLQRSRIKNDMDDRLLIGFGRPLGLALLFPGIDVPGVFKDMWEPHVYSRLFPERTKHFSRLLPGLGATQTSDGSFTDPGFYSAGRTITVDGPEPGEATKRTVKTRKSPIGVVANPVMGLIQGIVDITAEDRLPRARIWHYYPEGDEGLDSALGITTAGQATIVATPLPLGEFPLSSQGYPDMSELISNPPGRRYDLVSGNPDLSTPGFEVGQRLQFGTPQGALYDLTDSDSNGIFIGAVLAGCVLLLADKKGNPVTGSEVLVNGADTLEDIASEGGSGRGDTIFVGQNTIDLSELPEEGDSPTVEQMTKLAESLPDYRIQFDIGVGRRTGELIDTSLPTLGDVFPLPLQDLFGQKPPRPLSAIEGVVEFVNTERVPLKLPALRGIPADDSGDVQIPFLKSNPTELSLLGEVSAQFSSLLGSDSSAAPYSPPGGDLNEDQDWAAIFPDEIILNDGTLFSTMTSGLPNPPAFTDRNPATLYTLRDLRPVETAVGYSANSAIGDVRRFDLMIVEVGQPLVPAELNVGMTGILTVGECLSNNSVSPDTLSTLEPPRFVTPAPRGSTHRYVLDNAFGHLSTGYPAQSSGVTFSESFAGFINTLIDLSSVSSVILSSSSASTTGGILGILGTAGNAVRIDIWDPDPGAAVGSSLLGSITISSMAPGGTLWVFNPAGPTVTAITLDPLGTGVTLSASDILDIDTTTSILAALPLVAGNTFYDFTLTIDTFISAATAVRSGLAASSGGGSTTCEVSRDRLTFSERVSLASALPRGSHPANGDPTELGAQLDLREISTATMSDCTVNAASEVNGSAPFTFLERMGPSQDGSILAGVPYVGTFVAGAPGAEEGQLRMMAWEGFSNTPLPFPTDPVSGVIVSAVPSSDINESGVILEGTGHMRDDSEAGAVVIAGTQHWVENITAGGGAISNVMSGDLVVVDREASGEGAVKAGTYLVREVVNTNVTSIGGTNLLAQALGSRAGSRDTLDLRFPTVKSATSPTIVLEGVPSVFGSLTGCGFEHPATTTVYLYLILKNQYASYHLGSLSYTVDPTSVYRMEVSSISYNPATEEAVLNMNLGGSIQDATGTPISASDFFAAALRGVLCSGLSHFNMNPRASTGLPENNVVGFQEDDIGTELTAGFRVVTMGNLDRSNHGGLAGTQVKTHVWDKTVVKGDIEALLTGSDKTSPGTLGVYVPAANSSTTFLTDKATPIYGRRRKTASFPVPGTQPYPDPGGEIRGVAAHLSIGSISGTQWNEIHFDSTSGIAAGSHRLRCLLPGDQIMLGDDGSGTPTALTAPTVSGFWALSGIFLEPSFPRPVTDLASALPHVVSAGHNSVPAQVGARNSYDFTSSGVYGESVHFYVRRVRRWHEASSRISDNLQLLSYTYEMRRGDFGSYVPGTRTFTAGVLTYSTATNLGNFNNPSVNIHAGDTLRVLNAGGVLIDTAEIQKVTGPLTLKLRRPGLTSTLGAASFEIYLEQSIVPHEQSNQQLLELATDEIVFRRVVDYGAGDTVGGRVPANENVMKDTDAGGGSPVDWAQAGVEEGDYVIIDPAGVLYDNGESGLRPLGDQAVLGRAPFIGGSPAGLDDNRGFYRVITDPSTTSPNLEVSGASRFSGSDPGASDDVIFGDASSSSEYAVIPTVNASLLTGGKEGQATLRLTAGPVGTTYGNRVGLDQHKSIHPFGYTIIRPNPIFSRDALDLVLFTRERMLSFMEKVQGVYQSGKGGDYYIFQEDDHIEDVGSPTDPTDGSGVVSNLVISSLRGLVSETPYANVSDCLSVLGRRFWDLDTRLDGTGHTDFIVDGLDQRPVLPDLVEGVLDLEDRFRDLRFSWIRFRADRVEGSITSARRAEERLPDELQKQRELIAQKKTLGD